MHAAPRSGICQCYLVPLRTTTSDGSNYHSVTITRSGQSEATITIRSDAAEFTAYKEVYAGSLSVARGDVISLSVTVTGSPTPRLSNADFVVRCELTARES